MKTAIEQVKYFKSLSEIVRAVPLCLKVEVRSPDRAPMIAYDSRTGTLYLNQQLISGIDGEKLIPIQHVSGETVIYRLSDLSERVQALEREGKLETPTAFGSLN